MAAPSSAASSALSLVGLQLSSRLVTFALNQVLVRLTSAEAFGTVAIQLDFLLNTVRATARRAGRAVCVARL